MTPHQTATYMLNQGVATIPFPYRAKNPPLVKWKKYQTELPTETEIFNWYRVPRNIGIIGGWTGLAIVDFDDATVYRTWLLWATRKGGPAGWAATKAYRVFTARGVHLYTRLPHPTKSRALLTEQGERAGIDIKSNGGYVIAPPSIHPSGVEYRSPHPDAMIPTIPALSSVIPGNLLTAPANVKREGVRIPHRPTLDPWDAADNPISSNGLVARVKSHYRLEDLFEGSLPSGGDFIMVNCPLHDDKQPSMWVNTNEQICGCFAGCTPKPLDVIDLWSRMHDLTNREAIFDLGERL